MPSSNQLLAGLAKRDLALIRSSLEPVRLLANEVLEPRSSRVGYVYFVQSGLVSVVGMTKPNHRIEVGMIGSEGMTGLAVVLGDDRSANETLVQSSGTALRLHPQALREAMRASTALTERLLRYTHVFMIQGSQTAVANGRGKLSERLARWLAMWRDRLPVDDLTITHEFLSILLGVRRPGVTIAINELEGRGLLKATRTRVKIMDREGLRKAANGFYGVPEAEYLRLLGPRVRRPKTLAG
ncbi:Crp/Fnr family transcriptional regulator [soil metagenome]